MEDGVAAVFVYDGGAYVRIVCHVRVTPTPLAELIRKVEGDDRADIESVSLFSATRKILHLRNSTHFRPIVAQKSIKVSHDVLKDLHNCGWQLHVSGAGVRAPRR